jgi:hypothetical protein
MAADAPPTRSRNAASGSVCPSREGHGPSIDVMAILAALFTLGSRFAGKILTTALGWAGTLLFGRVPADRQILVLGITFGSVIWMALLAGVVFPNVGAMLLVLLPPQDFIPESVIRLVMLIGAIIVPAVVGFLTLALGDGDRSPKAILTAVARGYPLTALLAVLLVFLAGLGIWRKVTSVIKRWTDVHVPIVVRAAAYDKVASDLTTAIGAAGIEVTVTDAPAVMSKPARMLASVVGKDSSTLVPERLIQLDGKDLDILIYPMSLLVSGKPDLVNRARAALASRLTTTAAYMTTTEESQQVEDRLAALHPGADTGPAKPPRFDEAAAAELAAIDEQLADLPIEHEEWEVLYRMRLQVERDLRAGAMAGENVLGDQAVDQPQGVEGALATIGRLARGAATAAVEIVADDKTAKALDEATGSSWRWAARAAEVAHVAAREALEAKDQAETQADVTAGEPVSGQPTPVSGQPTPVSGQPTSVSGERTPANPPAGSPPPSDRDRSAASRAG